MREIRLCDDSAFEETIAKCNDNNLGIEIQAFADKIIQKAGRDGVNDPRLKVCLDIGHAHANSVMPVEQWIETLGDKIAYYHLHNNNGKKNIPGHNDDEHLGLNHGTINIASVLEKAEQYSPNAIWNLESSIQYHLEDIETLKSLGYIKSTNLSI